MKSRHCMILVGLCLGILCRGQTVIEIQAQTEDREYLLGETIRLAITVKNDSGNALRFNEWDDGRVYCRIEGPDDRLVGGDEDHMQTRRVEKDGREVEQTRMNLGQGLVLPPGAQQRNVVIINQLYQMSKPGHYRIQACLNHRRLTQEFRSKPFLISIKGGQEVLTKNIGLPADDDGPIVTRQCALVDFHYRRMQMYCLRISDERFIYAVRRLTKHIKGDRPQLIADARSQIHILIQTEPKLFTYWIYDLEGKLKQIVNYRVVKESIPFLHRDPDIGRVMVVGGRQVVPGSNDDEALPDYHPE